MLGSRPRNQPGRGVTICSGANRAGSMISRPELSIANADPLVGGQFPQPHRAAGADFVRADGDFRAHAEFGAVGVTSRGIPISGGGLPVGRDAARATLAWVHDAV